MSASVIFAVVKLLLMLIQRSGYAGEKEKGMDETEWNREGKTGRRERKVNEGTQQRIKMWSKEGKKERPKVGNHSFKTDVHTPSLQYVCVCVKV